MGVADVDVPRAVLAVLAVAVGATALFGALTTGAAYGAFNPSWEGTSDLRTTAEDAGSEPVIVRNTTQYEDFGEGDVAFVVAPTDGYDDADAARVRAFVERGGTLVVADRDGDAARALLEAVGADARPHGALLRDDRNHRRNPALPVADNVGDHPLVAGVDSITLNYGTAVEPDGATVLVTASEFAYLDADGSGNLSADERLAARPVATVEEVEDGRVVVVGDGSVFINSMQDERGNRAFATALVDGTDHALVDTSHREALPPLTAALLALRSSALLQVCLGLWTISMVGLATWVAGRKG